MQEFKNLPQPARMDEVLEITDHTWSLPDEDRLIACTRGGDLFVVEGQEVAQTLPFD